YLVVYDVNYGGAPGAYGLQVTAAEVAATAMPEPTSAHDSPSTAATIAGDSGPVVVTGDLATTDEVDVYQLGGFKGEDVVLAFTALARQQLEVLDDVGNVLSTMSPTARDHTANAEVSLLGGTRYLRVTFPAGVTKTPGGYTIGAYTDVSIAPLCNGP